MRTSNKILLGVYLTAILILAGIHIALYAKYKTGGYVASKDVWKLDYTRHQLKMVKYVVATGMDNITIIPSDTAMLEIEKRNSSLVRFQVIGDSLILRGDTVITASDGSLRVQKSWSELKIYLPSDAFIKGNNAEFTLKGSTDSNKALSYDIVLDNDGKVHFSENPWNDSSNRYYRNITVHAHSSTIEFAAHTVVDEMNLDLIHSDFEDKDAVINKVSIQSDQKSRLSVTGGNLQKLNLRKEP